MGWSASEEFHECDEERHFVLKKFPARESGREVAPTAGAGERTGLVRSHRNCCN